MSDTKNLVPYKFSVLTIFPELFASYLEASLIGKAIKNQIVEINLVNFRRFAEPPHFKVDDEIYGGGAGMLLKPEPLIKAITEEEARLPHAKKILLSASGKKFTQAVANELSKESELIMVCGRYEGVDQRVIDLKIDEEYCLADVVCMGGEVPAMMILEAITRLLTEGIGNPDSLLEESFSITNNQQTLLEAPQYTRPPEYEGKTVPEVLLSGNHSKIKEWRLQEAIKKTKKNRPDI